MLLTEACQNFSQGTKCMPIEYIIYILFKIILERYILYAIHFHFAIINNDCLKQNALILINTKIEFI